MFSTEILNPPNHLAPEPPSLGTDQPPARCKVTNMIPGRVPMFVVNSLDEVAEVAASAGDDVVLIFDVDNTLAPQGADPDELGKLVEAAIDRFEHDPAVRRVIVMTNGRQRGLSQVISRGNKPFTTRRRLGLDDSSGPVLVIGDQVLTDGLLAWRLRATFLHLVVDKASEDAQQARMRRVGRVAEPLLFRPPTTKCNG